jgi:hypothetical protein
VERSQIVLHDFSMRSIRVELAWVVYLYLVVRTCVARKHISKWQLYSDYNSWRQLVEDLQRMCKKLLKLKTFSYHSPVFRCVLIRLKRMLLAHQVSFVGQK